LALGSASIVFGVKLNTRITWYFWLGLMGGVFSFGNFLYWFCTQMFRRYLKRHHPEDPIFSVDAAGGTDNQNYDDAGGYEEENFDD
jgi:hypothetical protein